MEVNRIHGVDQIDPQTWNRLCDLDYPFLRHEFLSALEQSGSVCADTGWRPAHLTVTDAGELLAVMPMYLKQHSWGEYVFDQQWAEAYRFHGLHYYPKALSAIPLTPCQGPRIAFKPGVDSGEITRSLLAAIRQLADQGGISSWHCLFPDPKLSEDLRSMGLSIREGVQFQWFNRGYHRFDDFLQSLSAAKRKMIKRERRKIGEQGIGIRRVAGAEIDQADWRLFYEFYRTTYLKKGMQPYLNPEFFQQIARTMPEQLLLILAVREERTIAAALSFVGADCLYGRYWGCTEEFDALHFEVCYYQGLDFCIEHNLSRFDSGAQGEHKIARGFEPTTTYSAHWLKDARFAEAVDQFVTLEKKHLQSYKQDAAKFLPFKQPVI